MLPAHLMESQLTPCLPLISYLCSKFFEILISFFKYFLQTHSFCKTVLLVFNQQITMVSKLNTRDVLLIPHCYGLLSLGIRFPCLFHEYRCGKSSAVGICKCIPLTKQLISCWQLRYIGYKLITYCMPPTSPSLL